MEKESKHHNLNITISLVALFISVVTVSFVGWQSILERENFHKSQQPYITIVPSINSKKSEDGLYFFNSGNGTGILDNIEVYYKGVQIHEVNNSNVFISLVKKLGLNSGCFMFGMPRINDAVNLNEMNTIISTSSSIPPYCLPDVIKFNLTLSNNKTPFDIKIFYHSLYGDSFVYQLSDNSTASH
jgi:hypothetical protein